MNTRLAGVVVGFGLATCAAFASDPVAGQPISKEPIKGFTYRASSSPLAAVPEKIDPADAASSSSAPVAPGMEADSNPARPARLDDRSYAELKEDMEAGPLTAPCALRSRPLAHGAELDLLCAPIAPINGDTRAGSHQARFPLVSISL